MILCITHSRDYFNVDIFTDYLQSKNIQIFRLNTDQINHSQKLNVFFENGNQYFEITNKKGNKIHSKDIKAVWHRKSWGVTLPKNLEESFIEIFQNEYKNLRQNIFSCLKDVPWINDFHTEVFIENNKIYQLQIAKKYGLKIPETIYSNDSKTIKEFFKEKCSGKMIAKLHGSFRQSMSGKNAFFPTTILQKQDLNNLTDVKFSPMIFQPYIEKEYELRVMFVDGNFFVGKINSENSEDWRVMQNHYFWEKYDLPENVKKSIIKMMKNFGLINGAIDIIKDKNGNYVFLEVNPQGEWGMLQKELGFPIAETIAEALLKRI